MTDLVRRDLPVGISRRWWPSRRSAPTPSGPADLRGSAEAVAALLTGAGCPEVEVVSAGGGPAVLGRYPGAAGDADGLPVRPPRRPADRRRDAVDQPAVRGRPSEAIACTGAARATTRAASLCTWPRCAPSTDGRRSASRCSSRVRRRSAPRPWPRILADHHDRLVADVYVIADSGNWAVGEPAFTTTLRGLADCVVEVRTLDHAVHSGAYGGVAPDALTALCRLLATLHDEQGNVAIAGLHHGTGTGPRVSARPATSRVRGAGRRRLPRLGQRGRAALEPAGRRGDRPGHHPGRQGVEHSDPECSGQDQLAGGARR